MKRIFASAILSSLLAISSTAFAATTDSLTPFNIRVNGAILQITTNIPNHVYTQAGIKVNTKGYTVNTNPPGLTFIPTPSCTNLGNGFCQFVARASTPTTILIQGPSNANVNVTVCLNGRAPATCQSLTYWYVGII